MLLLLLLTARALLGQRHRAGGAAQSRPSEIVSLAEAERRYLRWALATFKGDRRELARRLGLTERTFYRKTRDLA